MPIHVSRSEADYDTAAQTLCRQIDGRRGMLFRSGTEAPGRYARWDIGLCDPAIELRAKDRALRLVAHNEQGRRLLSLFLPALQGEPTVAHAALEGDALRAALRPMDAVFSEEERSRQPSLFTALRALLGTLQGADPYLGFYGAFGYDLAFQFEPIRLRHDRAGGPDDCVLFLPLEVLVVDRRRETARWHRYDVETPAGRTGEVAGGGQDLPRVATAADPGRDVRSDQTPEAYMRKVEEVRRGCARGDYFEVVLSQKFSVPCALPGSVLFERLSQRNPSPYLFYFNLGDEQLVGSSPEMYLRVELGEARTIETCPIAGTVRRGADAVEDAQQRARLYGSAKDESELTMCTDVDRNDLSRVCAPGSVNLLGRRLIESYSKLIHTVDHVRGDLRPECDALDGFVSHMWACTVTGAPKKIALQTIEDLEESPRGYYAGAIGFASASGQLNSGITLRTLHLRDGIAHVRAGATLLYDSDPAAEEQETRLKASALLDAVLSDEAPPAEPQLERAGEGLRVLFVDCEDSFVQTLGSYVRATGAEVVTYRPGFPEGLLDRVAPDLLFLSPGPKAPRDFDLGTIIGWATARRLPVFGVCLGHQGLAEFFGARLGILPEPVHGKPGTIEHDGDGLFQGLPQGFTAARYHSLYVLPETVPPELRVTARASDGVIMALAHRSLPIWSVQFHPESILTLQGQAGFHLLSNLFKLLRASRRSGGHA